VVVTVGHATSTPQGVRHQRLQLRWWPLPDMPPAPSRRSAIDIFNFGDGRCRTYRQHPLGSPPSTSSTSVVVATGHTASTPRGDRHRRLQLRWWPLPDMLSAPPRGPAIDVSNFGGGRCQTCRQHPLGGPPSTSPTSVVAAVRPAASTSQEAHHRRLQLLDLQLRHLPGAHRQCFLALMVGAPGPPALAPPRGPPSNAE
jgi:hypothetical protein